MGLGAEREVSSAGNKKSLRTWLQVSGINVSGMKNLAERGGFEPPLRLLTVNRFSKPAPSATRPPLRWNGMESCAPTQGQVFSPILSGVVHVLMGLFPG